MTVGELVAHLQHFHPDRPIIIEDADTGWDVSIIHIEVDRHQRVVLSGKYSEMFAPKYNRETGEREDL